jgi:cryptochrome
MAEWIVLLHTTDVSHQHRYVVQGKPETVLPELWGKWKATRMTYEVDTEPYAIARDCALGKLAKAAGM